jgi:hypothetical protein
MTDSIPTKCAHGLTHSCPVPRATSLLAEAPKRRRQPQPLRYCRRLCLSLRSTTVLIEGERLREVGDDERNLFGLTIMERPPFKDAGAWLACGALQVHLILGRRQCSPNGGVES